MSDLSGRTTVVVGASRGLGRGIARAFAESGAVFHTYSCYVRGVDMMNATYQYLDLTPKGRDEDGPEGPQAWVRYHDRYEDRAQ